MRTTTLDVHHFFFHKQLTLIFNRPETHYACLFPGVAMHYALEDAPDWREGGHMAEVATEEPLKVFWQPG